MKSTTCQQNKQRGGEFHTPPAIEPYKLLVRLLISIHAGFIIPRPFLAINYWFCIPSLFKCWMHFSWLELPNGFFSLFMATWRRLVLAYIHGKAAKCRNNLGSWWLKSAKNTFSLYVISQDFLNQFSLNFSFISVFGHCMEFIFKNCQSLAGLSVTSRFREFFESHFRRVFSI